MLCTLAASIMLACGGEYPTCNIADMTVQDLTDTSKLCCYVVAQNNGWQHPMCENVGDHACNGMGVKTLDCKYCCNTQNASNNVMPPTSGYCVQN